MYSNIFCQKELQRILENKENKIIEEYFKITSPGGDLLTGVHTLKLDTDVCLLASVCACVYVHRYLHTYSFIQRIFKHHALYSALFSGGYLAVNKIDKNPCPHNA